MNSKLATLLTLAASVSVTNADILIQELFDNISTGNASLNGAPGTATSIGLTGNWATNGSTGVNTASNFNVNGSLPGLPPDGGALGGVWNGTGSYSTSIHATRQLQTPVSFATERTIFFSVRLNNPGDTAMGVGLSSGSATSSSFVGAGFSWNNAIALGETINQAGNSPYISYGALDQQSGPYGIRAYQSGRLVNTFGLLVGRIKIHATGADEIDIKRYAPDETIDSNLNAIVWSASSTVNSSMNATHLLLWMNGSGSGELDAIRFGDTWTDVTGVTLASNDQPAMSSAAVTDITASGATATANLFSADSEVTLFWDFSEFGTDPGSWTYSAPLGTKPVGPVSGAITNLDPDTRYYYRFRAVNTVADPDLEGWSEENRSFVTPPTGLSVTDLEAFPTSAYEVDLVWSDNFATETSFIIQRSPAGANTWATIGTAPADTMNYLDSLSGLQATTSYDYRVLVANASGTSDPSNVSTATTLAIEPMETKLLINFDGTLDGTTYTLAEDEVDATGTFRANGAPTLSNGVATLNPGAENGLDGFDINPAALGDLRAKNWVAEAVVTYNSSDSLVVNPYLIDVQGDTNLRLRSATDPNVLQLFYYNGTTTQQNFSALPPSGVKVHVAIAWDASATRLTGYVNGAPIGSVSAGPFARPDVTTLSFGYLGRTNFVGKGIDGTLDAVSFQTGTGTFDPATDFRILPETQSFAAWIGGFDVGGLTGFDDDADGDGLTNGLEGFMGTNPSAANGSAITQVSSNGTVTTFIHPQADPALADVTGTYEWSPDLATWYAGNGMEGPEGGPTVGIPTVSPVGGTSTVTATSSAPLQRLFIRIVADN